MILLNLAEAEFDNLFSIYYFKSLDLAFSVYRDDIILSDKFSILEIYIIIIRN